MALGRDFPMALQGSRSEAKHVTQNSPMHFVLSGGVSPCVVGLDVRIWRAVRQDPTIIHRLQIYGLNQKTKL